MICSTQHANVRTTFSAYLDLQKLVIALKPAIARLNFFFACQTEESGLGIAPEPKFLIENAMYKKGGGSRVKGLNVWKGEGQGGSAECAWTTREWGVMQVEYGGSA